MGIISFAGTEQSFEGVVSRNDKASKVCEELPAEVEEDEEEVGRDNTEEGVDLGDRSLLLEVVQKWILGELVALSASVRLLSDTE